MMENNEKKLLIENPISMELVDIDIGKIEKFIESNIQRKIRESQVKYILLELVNGVGIKNNLIVNKINYDGKIYYRVIDGNHRILAIKKFFDLYPTEIIKVPLTVYQVPIDREALIYDTYSKQVSQSSNDYLKNHCFEIPIANKILTNLCIKVSHYSRENSTLFKWIISLWQNKENSSHYTGTREQLLNFAKRLNENDFNEMNTFFKKYKDIFGSPSTNNEWSYSYLYLAMSIYYRNIEIFEDTKLWSIISENIPKYFKIIKLTHATMSSNGILTDMRFGMLMYTNRKLRGNKLV